MKKIILPLFLMLFSLYAHSQCVPGTLTKPQAGYIIPDSATNFAHACIGQYYEQIIYIKAPKDTVASGLTAVVDSFVMNKNIVGLPVGLSVTAVPGFTPAAPGNPNTNFERLIIKGDSLACIKVSGIIPAGTTPAVSQLTIEVRAYLRLLSTIPLDTTANVGYYAIDMLGAPCWPAAVNDVDRYGFSLLAAVPNPFSGTTQLSFESANAETYVLRVLNILGEEVHRSTVSAQAGMNYVRLDASGWASGLYMYSLSDGKHLLSSKLQVR